MFQRSFYRSISLLMLVLPSTAFGEVPVGAITNIQPVSTLDQGNARDCCPAVMSNGLEIWFSSRNRFDGSSWDIYQATRESIDQPFGDPVQIETDINNSFFTDAASYMTPDGLTMLMYSNRPGTLGGNDLYVASRESTSEPFSGVSSLGDVLIPQLTINRACYPMTAYRFTRIRTRISVGSLDGKSTRDQYAFRRSGTGGQRQLGGV